MKIGIQSPGLVVLRITIMQFADKRKGSLFKEKGCNCVLKRIYKLKINYLH